MPRFVNPDARETTVLHAPWWSERQDEHGQYLERCVVYREMTERDSQIIARNTAPSMTARKGAKIEMEKYVSQGRVQMLLRMVVEITDEQGTPLPISARTFEMLHTKDSEWIADQLDELNEPLVTPTEEMEADAEEQEADAHELAADRFRRPRRKAVHG